MDFARNKFDALPPIVGLLDVGTGKIACLMLARDAGGHYVLIGAGHQVSGGVKAGVVVDADAAEDAVRAAVAQAEAMAEVRLRRVVLAAQCGRLGSMHLAVGAEVAGGVVGQSLIDGLLDAARAHAERDDRAALHINAISARLDGQPTGQSPVGLPGRRLELDVNAVVADRAPLRSLMHLVERSGLEIEALLPAPLATALAVTTPDEREQNCLVIDCGAGTTGLALFVAGVLVALHTLPVGANHLNYDLMRGLGATFEEAERIKRICDISQDAHPAGTANSVTAGGNRHDLSRSTGSHGTGAHITTLLTSRADALFAQVAAKLAPLALPAGTVKTAVLAGGGSALRGLAERAGLLLEIAVRVGEPVAAFVPAALRTGAFATAAGLEPVIYDRALGFRFDTAAAPPVAAKSRSPGWARPSF